MKEQLPPSTDYLEVPGCDLIIKSPDGRPVNVGKVAAILMRLAAQKPHLKINFWIEIDD
jgi:hypothetical protein